MQNNDTFFSFPPYLSTAWENVSAINLNGEGKLVFHLLSGESITLPLLPSDVIEKIYMRHAAYLQRQVLKEPLQKKERPFPFAQGDGDTPIRFAFGTPDGMTAVMQHNPAQSQANNLPEEMLSKIAEVSKILTPNDPKDLPKPEPHCNCYFCQIARAIQINVSKVELIEEEVISDSDLQFQQWKITQTGDKLYSVSNKLDERENYSVYLGHPVGCTCGKQGCEHILVVLKS